MDNDHLMFNYVPSKAHVLKAKLVMVLNNLYSLVSGTTTTTGKQQLVCTLELTRSTQTHTHPEIIEMVRR